MSAIDTYFESKSQIGCKLDNLKYLIIFNSLQTLGDGYVIRGYKN